MYGITIHVTAPGPPPQTDPAYENNMRRAALYMAQAKLNVQRALRALPGDRPGTRRVLESLATALQIAVEAAQKLAVSEGRR